MRPFVEWVKDPDHGFIISRHWDPVDGWQGAGRLELFDIQERVLAHCLTPVPGEKRFPYTTAIYSCCKKSGKTTTGAAVATWYGEESPEGTEIYLLANDIDQTLRAYGFITYHLRKKGYKPQKYFFEFPNGTQIRGIAQEYRSAAGANPGLTLWDELWGYICPIRTTKVLKADLTWVSADSLEIGDKLVSFDEERQGTYRAFRTGTVVSTGIKTLPVCGIRLSNGTELFATPNHPWLARRGNHNEVVWVRTDELQPTDKLMLVLPVWEGDVSWDAAYLAAAFDGEGCLSVNPESLGYSMRFDQRNNEMWEQVITSSQNLGFDFHLCRTHGGTNRDVYALNVGSKAEVVRLLGTIRPRRLLPKFSPDCLGRMTATTWVKVESVEAEALREVVTLGVDCKTYLANGYASHNSETSRRLWAEMTPPPTVPFPLRFIVTYAGFEEESELLYDLYKKTVLEGEPVPELIDIEDKQGKPVCWRSKDHTVFAYWDHEPRMPWQTEDYYREQMATLRPMDYLRLHKNRWVTSQEAFMPVDLWDAAVERGKEVELVSPLLYGTHKFKRYPIYVAVDIGTKHDASAVVGCYYDYTRGRVGVAFHKIWVPEPGEGLDLETTVELYIQQVVRGMPNVVLVACDPSQFHRSKITLQKKGIKVEEFAQSNKNLTLATENLYDLLRNGILEAYPADDLRDHLKYAVVEHTNSGYRLSKEKHAKYKIDGAVALACAAYFAVASGGVDTKREIIVRSRSSDFTAMPLPSEQAAIEATLPEAMKTEPTWRRVI